MWTAENTYQMIQQILYNCEEDRTVLIRKPQVISGEGVHLLHPPPRSVPGSGCKKYLTIKGTRNYYFKTLGYCSITKVNSSLISRRFYATWPRLLEKKLSWHTAKGCWRLQFIYIYNACVLPNNKLSLSFYLLFISFYSTKFKLIKAMFKLCWKAFAPPGKPYQVGLLFIHKNGWGGLISVCDGAKLRLGSDL